MKAVLPWLSLNEAAWLVAERLISEQRQSDCPPPSALENARAELLKWAYCGQLEVHGRPWDIPGPEEPDDLYEGRWNVIDTSMWDPYRLREAAVHPDLQPSVLTENQDDTEQVVSIASILESARAPSSDSNEGSQPIGLYVVIDWQKNLLTIDGPGVFEPYGYSDLKVRRVDMEEILPPEQTSAELMGASGGPTESTRSPPSRHSGGAPRKYADDLFIEIIRIANGIDGLPEHKGDLVRQLRAYHAPSWGDDRPSESTIQRIVDMVYKRLFAHSC